MSIVLIILTGAVITFVCGLAWMALTAPRTEAELGYEAFMDSDPARVPPPDGPVTGGRAVFPPDGGAPVLSEIDGDGTAVPEQRDRPALFLVSRK